VRLDPGQPLAELLADLQARQSALMAHQYLGLAEIRRAAGPGAGFDTLLAYESFPHSVGGDKATPPISGLKVSLGGGRDGTHYPLSLAVGPGRRLRLRLSYRPDLFDSRTAEAVSGALAWVLEQIAADPGQLTGRLELLPGDQRRQVVRDWNDTGAPVQAASLAEGFARQVARTPDASAVASVPGAADAAGRAGEWSFAELDAASGRVAAALAGPPVIAMYEVAVQVTAHQ